MWGRTRGFSWSVERERGRERERDFFQASLQLDVNGTRLCRAGWRNTLTSLLEGGVSKLSSCSRRLLDASAPGGEGEPDEPGDCGEENTQP